MGDFKNIIHAINRINPAFATYEDIKALLPFASSDMTSVEVRLSAKHKISLILWAIPRDQREAKVRDLFGELMATNGTWLQRNLLECMAVFCRGPLEKEVLTYIEEHIDHPLVRDRALALYGRKNANGGQ